VFQSCELEIHAQNESKSADRIKTEIKPESNTNTIIHTCQYCHCVGYDITFDNSDLLERHGILKHPGWTANP
jgi:hypothetical protein